MRPVEVSPHLHGVRTRVHSVTSIGGIFRYIVLWSRADLVANTDEDAATMMFENYFNTLIKKAACDGKPRL